jgi:hypothetical protein
MTEPQPSFQPPTLDSRLVDGTQPQLGVPEASTLTPRQWEIKSAIGGMAAELSGIQTLTSAELDELVGSGYEGVLDYSSDAPSFYSSSAGGIGGAEQVSKVIEEVYQPSPSELVEGFTLGKTQSVVVNDPNFPTHSRYYGEEPLCVINFGGVEEYASGTVVRKSYLDQEDGVMKSRISLMVEHPGKARVERELRVGQMETIGRGQRDLIDIVDTVSRDHFAIGLDKYRRIVVENHNPTNNTEVKYPEERIKRRDPLELEAELQIGTDGQISLASQKEAKRKIEQANEERDRQDRLRSNQKLRELRR